MYKKLFIIAAPLLFLIETNLYADTVQSCDDKTGIACQKPAFSLDLTALYFKAISDSLPVKSSTNYNAFDNFDGGRTNNRFNGPWDWAGMIKASYLLNDNSDLNLSWMFYSVDYRGGDHTRSVYDYTYDENRPSINLDQSFTSGKLKVNSVNAEYGQTITLSPTTDIRFSGGVQYLNIKTRSNISSLSSYSDRSGSGFNTSNSYRNEKYQGIGPRVGLDVSRKLKGNFTVFANSAATILLARHTTNTNSGASSNYSSSDSVFSTRNDVAIPELEAKLGITYNKPLSNGMLSISTGWYVINYFNLKINDTDSNLTLSGPFLQAKWVG